MTLCEKCIHKEVCNIRDCHEEGDEEALKWCSNHKPKSRFVELPCEVGQTVYSIEVCLQKVFVGEVFEIFLSKHGIVFAKQVKRT